MRSDLLVDNKRARQLRRQAEALAGRPELFSALGTACLDPARHAAVLAKPLALLKKAGLTLPEGLAFELFERAPRYLPFPEWTPWVIEPRVRLSIIEMWCEA